MMSQAPNAPAGGTVDAASQVLLMPALGAALEPAVAAAPLWQSFQQPLSFTDAALVQPQQYQQLQQQFTPLPQPFQQLQQHVLGFHLQPPQFLHQDCQPQSCPLPPYQQQQQQPCEPQTWCPLQLFQQQPLQQQTFQQQPLQSRPLHQQPFQQPLHVPALQQSRLLHLQQAAGPMAVQSAPPAPPASVDEHEVVAAIETLYADQLKPYGRILRKRLEERAVAAGSQAPEFDTAALKATCESCCVLRVEREEGGDWSVLLRDRLDAFVDVYSPEDAYAAGLWSAMGRYLEGPEGAALKLAGGRYSCAQDLVARRLPFLAGLSLGQICHLVQLAISQKKLLGYLEGAVVPYGRSQSLLKQRCAARQCASGTTAKGAGLGTWDMLRSFLEGALGCLGSEEFTPLSNLKRLFKQRHGAELSETALGHSKLSELLRDPRVSDLCTVRLRNHGYAVFPAPRPAAPAEPRRPIRLADGLLGEGPGGSATGRSPGGAPARPRPAALGGAHSPRPPAGPGGDREVVFPPTLEGEMPHGRAGVGLPTLLASRAGPRAPAAAAEGKKPKGEKSKGGIWAVPLLTPSTLDHLRSSERKTFIHIAATPPAGSSSRASSVPRYIN